MPNEDFIAKDQRFFERVATHELEDECFGHIHDLLTAIGIFSHPFSANTGAQTLRDLYWNYAAYASID